MTGPEELIDLEIRGTTARGKAYADQTAKGVFDAVKSTSRAILGETTLVRTEGGRWVTRTVSPGLRHLIAIGVVR